VIPKPCSSCWSPHLLREEFLSTPFTPPSLVCLIGSSNPLFDNINHNEWKYIMNGASTSIKMKYNLFIQIFKKTHQSVKVIKEIFLSFFISVNLSYHTRSSSMIFTLAVQFWPQISRTPLSSHEKIRISLSGLFLFLCFV
jgi:hypothetical protein